MSTAAEAAGPGRVPPVDLWPFPGGAHRFIADFSETHGGVTLSIDADNLDAPVATTAFGYQVTSGSNPAAARTGPGGSYPVVTTYPAGTDVTVACQAPGSAFGTTTVWDKLTDGSYVTDFRVDTPSDTGYSAPVARCRYPYQVTPATGANQRGGPGASYAVTGRLPGGALAWVVCQQAGGWVGRPRVWDKVSDKHWVSDAYVATPGATGFSRPPPRC